MVFRIFGRELYVDDGDLEGLKKQLLSILVTALIALIVAVATFYGLSVGVPMSGDVGDGEIGARAVGGGGAGYRCGVGSAPCLSVGYGRSIVGYPSGMSGSPSFVLDASDGSLRVASLYVTDTLSLPVGAVGSTEIADVERSVFLHPMYAYRSGVLVPIDGVSDSDSYPDYLCDDDLYCPLYFDDDDYGTSVMLPFVIPLDYHSGAYFLVRGVCFEDDDDLAVLEMSVGERGGGGDPYVVYMVGLGSDNVTHPYTLSPNFGYQGGKPVWARLTLSRNGSIPFPGCAIYSVEFRYLAER